MYADDLSILASDQTPEAAANRLRRACCVLESWTRKHSMSINTDKSETVLFTLSTHTAEDASNPSIKLAGRTLRHTKMGEDMVSQLLGMRLDHRLNLNVHMAVIKKSAVVRVGQLASVASIRNGPQPASMLAFHRGYVESKLLQGAAVYALPQKARDDPHDDNRTALEALCVTQRRSLRATTGLLQSTDPESVYLETRSLPISELAKLRSAYLAEKYKRTQPAWFVRPPPEPPPSTSHNLVPQTRCALENIHAAFWTARLPPDQLRSVRRTRPAHAPWVTATKHAIHFHTQLPPASTPDEKRAASEAALTRIPPHTITLSTDGSVRTSAKTGAPVSMAAAILTDTFGSLSEETRNCGPVADSYRTETEAIRIGLDLAAKHAEAMCALAPEAPPRMVIITDSQSALRRLQRGPLAQQHPTESDIWSMLLDLSSVMEIHLQFVYGHCGIPENEAADALASSNISTYATTAPLSEANARAHIKRNVIAKWREQLGTTHRSTLVGHRPTPKHGRCAILGQPLTREEQVHLARLRTGQSELFGIFRRRTHVDPHATWAPCRWCSAQDPPDHEDPDPPSPPTTTIDCPVAGCEHTSTQMAHMDLHIRKKHPCEGPAKCPWCGEDFKSVKSRGMHYKACRTRAAAAPAPPPQGDTHEPPTIGHAESIAHIVVCDALAEARQRHHVPAYIAEFKEQYFFSLPFLHWAHDVLGGPLSTPACPDPETIITEHNNNYYINSPEVDDWDFDCDLSLPAGF
eukprot:PhM_4_TR8461/c0_g1_i1/m.79128